MNPFRCHFLVWLSVLFVWIMGIGIGTSQSHAATSSQAVAALAQRTLNTTEQQALSAPTPSDRRDEVMDWVAFGLGVTSVLLLLLGLLATPIFSLPAVILGVLSIGFAWFRRRIRRREGWRLFVGQLGGSLVLLVFFTALILVAFA